VRGELDPHTFILDPMDSTDTFRALALTAPSLLRPGDELGCWGHLNYYGYRFG
jgi:hypothetical protein